jgi:type II secretory pathway component PulM
MTALLDRIIDWYQSLQPQEQRILLYGTPLILLLVLYLVLLQPLGSAYFERKSEMSERIEDIAWVRDQRLMLGRLNTSCDLRSQIFTTDTFEDDIDAAARRFGVVPEIQAARGSTGYEMQIPGAEGNRILSLIRVLACGGAKVTSLEMQRSATETDELSATLSIIWAGSGA